ncbi:SurA N-terminal domain-containing protein [Psychromonas sp. MME2]|uniref:SurA N-terminal domain-containing protein n=1 Tax=unclassified Psychromonas TaxID=2614957 RepID=UPI00339BE48F
MLDKLREGSQGIAAKVILSVIILSFALAGISGYLGGSSATTAVIVNDQEISQASVEKAYQNERQRLQQQYGEQFDILAANPNFAQQLKAQATQTLISEALIAQAIKEMGLRVGDEQIKNAIREMAEFQVDGKFDNEQYLSVLRRVNYTPAQFSESMKQDLTRRQLLQMLVDSEFVLPTEVSLVQQLQSQQRIANVLTVKSDEFVKDNIINADKIDAYYQNNRQLFQYPEQVSVDYVLLDGDQLTSQVSVNQADIENYYDNHQSDYKRSERRKVAHILVQGDNDQAKQKAQAILMDINNGSDFALLAREKSEDTLSAKNNGELDWFEGGVMDPAFDKAAFALTVDAPVSGLVKSQYGYHIIKLLDIQPGKTLPLNEVQAQVKKALLKDKANELYFEMHQQLSEVSFESPDDLTDSANAINGEVVHTELFSAEEAPQALVNKAVLQKIFDADFRAEGVNSEVIELGDNKSIVVRINNYKPASTKPLTEVTDVITTQLKAEQASADAMAFTKSIVVKLNANESIAEQLSDKNLNFVNDVNFTRYSRDYDYQVIEKLFKMPKPVDENVMRDWVKTTSGDYIVVELLSVIEQPTDNSPMAAQINEILQRSTSDSIYQAFIAELMEQAEIKYAVAN